jgi:hypothetical protein
MVYNLEEIQYLLKYFSMEPDFIEIIDGKYYFDLTHVCKGDDAQTENCD